MTIDEIIKDIQNPETQLELISQIRAGKILFKKKEGITFSFTTIPYHKTLWISTDKRIKTWHEDPGFMSFTYLTFDKGTDQIDTLKYGSEISLTIQNPSHDWLGPKFHFASHARNVIESQKEINARHTIYLKGKREEKDRSTNGSTESRYVDTREQYLGPEV